MARKLYKSKIRYDNIASFHLAQLRERVRVGLIPVHAEDAYGNPATPEWVYLFDCKDHCFECIVFAALAVLAEGVILLRMTDSHLIPQRELQAFRKGYLRSNGHAQVWPKVRPALEHLLGQLRVRLPFPKPSQHSNDALDGLFDHRNEIVHLMPRQDCNKPTRWYLNPLEDVVAIDPAPDVGRRYLNLARENHVTMNSVLDCYQEFWRLFHARYDPSRSVIPRHR